MNRFPNGPLGGIRILTNKAQRVVDLMLIDAGDILAKKFAHAQLIELLYSVHQLKMAIGGNALPVKLEVVRVLDFVNQLAEKQVHQFIKGIFPSGYVMLAQDGGELVVFLLLG